jgi:hypothetical protein
MVIIPIHKDYNKKMPIQTSKTAIFSSHNVISRVGQNIESILWWWPEERMSGGRQRRGRQWWPAEREEQR